MPRILVLIAMPLKALGNSRNGKRRVNLSQWQVFCTKLGHSAQNGRYSVCPHNKPACSFEILCNNLYVSCLSVSCRKPLFKKSLSSPEMNRDMAHADELV